MRLLNNFSRFDIATPSCIWRPDGSGYMSLYGRVYII